MIDPKIIRKAYISEFLSEKQIAEKFGTSSRFVRNCLDSLKVQRRSRSEAIRYIHLTKHGKRNFVLKANLSQKEQQLKLAGSMLYWGEGAKHGGTVSFANSDPEMIKVFLKFLRKVCGVSEERLRLTLHYYEDHNPPELMNFWSNVTDIPLKQFHTPYLHTRRVSGTYKRPSLHGTVQIRYNDSKLLEVIKSWISSYAKSK